MFYEQMLINLTKLQKQIDFINTKLQNLPEGNFVCSNTGKNYKWYCTDGKKKSYIPKGNQEFAAQLAYKKHLKWQLQELEKEKKAVELYLRRMDPQKNTPLPSYINHPEYQRLISTYQDPLSKELQDWMIAPYEKSQKYPEKLIHKISSGNVFRSKSEAMIALCLEKHRIPYRYENALYFGEIVVHPDFTIRHPKTGETFYWEHFGLMDQPDYFKNAYTRLNLYNAHGIIPSVHLIATFETREYPLDIAKVEAFIDEYFL